MDKEILERYDNLKRKRVSKEERLNIYNKHNGRCGYCGEKIDIKDMQVDHIAPLKSYEEGDNMIFIRDDFYVDNILESEIEEGYLRLLLTNDTIYGKITNELLLSRESVENLIVQLIQEYPNITQIESSKELL